MPDVDVLKEPPKDMKQSGRGHICTLFANVACLNAGLREYVWVVLAACACPSLTTKVGFAAPAVFMVKVTMRFATVALVVNLNDSAEYRTCTLPGAPFIPVSSCPASGPLL